MRIPIRFSSLLASAILVGAFAVSGLSASARPLDEVKAANLLRVVVYADYAPFSWEENGEPKGIEVDLGRAIAKKLGVEAEITIHAPGEDVDDDLRSNIWQGPRFGAPKSDVMLHVPMEREFIARNNLVAISNPYYKEQFVVAVNSTLAKKEEGLAPFQKLKVACEFSTAAHYFLSFVDEAAYQDNVSPYRHFNEAADLFKSGQIAGLIGRRAQIEYFVGKTDFPHHILEPKFPDTLRGEWNIGTAVKEDSRDLGYTIGAALAELRTSGELEKIFASYGVSLVPPATQ